MPARKSGILLGPLTSWAPGIAFGGASVGATYALQAGSYQRAGNIVRVQGYLALSAKGSSTGQAAITGLPVAMANADYSYGTSSLVLCNSGFSGITTPVFIVGSPAATQLLLVTQGATGTAAATDALFTDTSVLLFSCDYFV